MKYENLNLGIYITLILKEEQGIISIYNNTMTNLARYSLNLSEG